MLEIEITKVPKLGIVPGYGSTRHSIAPLRTNEQFRYQSFYRAFLRLHKFTVIYRMTQSLYNGYVIHGISDGFNRNDRTAPSPNSVCSIDVKTFRPNNFRFVAPSRHFPLPSPSQGEKRIKGKGMVEAISRNSRGRKSEIEGGRLLHEALFPNFGVVICSTAV